MAETQVHVHVKPNEEHYGTSKYIKVNRITGEELPLPVQSGTLKYTGGNQSPTWENYDRDKMTVSGISGVNAGIYTAKFVLKKGFYWEDGTITSKEINWVIEKADGYVNLANDSIRVRKNKTETIEIINASGNLSIEEYDTEKMTVTIVDDQVSIKGLKAGEYSFDVEVAASNNYTSATKTINVTVISDGEIYGVRFNTAKYISQSGIRTEDAADFPPAQFYTSGTQYPPYRVSNPTSPFNEISPWKDMVIVESSKYGTLLKIPKFYYRLLVDDGFEIQICNTKLEGFEICPLCMDRNDGQGEREFAYIGVYPSLKSNGYKSQKGVKLNSGEVVSIDQLRNKIHDLGKTAFLQDGTVYWTLMYLYLVEIGTMYPSYALSGYTGSWNYDIGCTDAAPYHSSVDYFGKYRGIEAFTMFRSFYIDGVIDDNVGSVYTILNPLDSLTGENKVKVDGFYTYGLNYNASKWKLTGNPMMPIVGIEQDVYYANGSIGRIGCAYSGGSQSSMDNYYMSVYYDANLQISAFDPNYWKVSIGRLMVLPDTIEKQEGYINCEDEVDVISYNDWIEIPVTASGDWSISKSYQDASDLYNCSINIIKDNNKLKIKGISGIGHYYIELYTSENDNYYDATKIINVYVDLDGIRFDPSYNRTVTMNVGDSTTISFTDSWKGSKVYSISWYDPSSTKNTASVNNGSIIINAYEAGTFHLSLKNTNSDQTDMLTVIVTGKPESHIYFSPDHITMNKNSKANIIIQGYDSDTTRYTYLPKGGIEQGKSVISWDEYNLNDGSPTIVFGSSYYTGVFTIQVEKRYKASMALIETATLTITVV